MQQDKTKYSTLLTYYEEIKANMIVNNNDKNHANNLFNMILMQVKKTKHGSNKNYICFGINRKMSLRLQK